MIGFYEWLFGTREQNLTEMTKVELEALGRKHNIELDRRLKKATLIKQKNIESILVTLDVFHPPIF